MKIELLRSCIDTLKAVEMQLHDVVDPNVTKELARVIIRLELVLETDVDEVVLDAQIVRHTLDVIGRIAVVLIKGSDVASRLLG